jgi:hypothetical protein
MTSVRCSSSAVSAAASKRVRRLSHRSSLISVLMPVIRPYAALLTSSCR